MMLLKLKYVRILPKPWIIHDLGGRRENLTSASKIKKKIQEHFYTFKSLNLLLKFALINEEGQACPGSEAKRLRVQIQGRKGQRQRQGRQGGRGQKEIKYILMD